MIIYDSRLKKKVEFKPIDDEIVRIYVCGPTVYDDAHLGHAKSSISFDLLRRVLLNLGYRVKFVKNFTDIDDKILKKMDKSGKSLEEITNFYTNRYLDDMKALNVLRADLEPKATENLDEIIKYILALLQNNFAYKIENDGIYFDTSKDDEYLSLSGKSFDDESLARIKSSEFKKNKQDFVLWKFDEKWYESPFGKGRPGWHTECVAMIKAHLDSGNDKFSIDIHAGGADLLFPHHENEAAQCRCAENKSLAKYWMHNGFVQVDNEKMSKSLNNSFFIKDALNLVPGEALRFYLMSTHYRANFNYSIDDLKASKKRLDKIYRLKDRVNDTKKGEVNLEFKEQILSSLKDDLNSSLALSYVDSFVNLSNEFLDKNPKNRAKKGEILANLEFIKDVFGILEDESYFQFGVSKDEKEEILNLIEKRNLAKIEKNYALADEIRDVLNKKGISIMDTPNGTKWEKI
ncbi:cysteine--tRNA ligase [Campylobacter sp. FMV-PI01]|uniref:Cysteine--tRNA ligase n=1 Tax=Campylobacter portucalensis TaxID=2608384 RepID=A0A6L5WIB7_9BACT|nr:cysteine--tRNA ligase [Campylobacter portucalensis]MSN96794.1 cysteine--tRNA ligase [Campylobacter portucalensis]